MSEVFSEIQKHHQELMWRLRKLRFWLFVQHERDAALIRTSRAAVERSIQLLKDTEPHTHTHTQRPRSVESELPRKRSIV